MFDRSGLLVPKAFNDLRSRTYFPLLDGLAELFIVCADATDFCAVERGVAVGEERGDGDPLQPHINGEYVVVFVYDGYRPVTDEMDVPLAVSVDELRGTDLLVGEEARVFLGGIDEHPAATSLFFLVGVDEEFESVQSLLLPLSQRMVPNSII